MNFIAKWYFRKILINNKNNIPITFSEYCLFWFILPFIIFGIYQTAKENN